MKYIPCFSIVLCILISNILSAQKWVDTLYQIQQTNDIAYDTQTDFAGNSRSLTMNITVPVNDTPPSCGRPLLVAIHGGAFLTGNKDMDAPPAIMRDFAKRGFTTASINYRLGMFHTNAFVNCNVSMFGIPWNCLNMQDTSEWFRAAYRGMQDARSAIRYLVNHAATYNIDVRNIYVVGESAGGFIALASVFMDDNSEKPAHCNALANAQPPNALYENQCIQTPGFDTSIASMNLARPDLGDVNGSGNPTTIPYTIKGVGNFYGGIMSDLFSNYTYTQAPVLYMYHQPNDLVVPYNYDNVLQGEAYCFTQFPANCQWLVNRPKVYGSKGVKNMIDGLSGIINQLPAVYFDSTFNNTDCLGQIANASLVGHAIDNYWLRTTHMAQFFAPTIDTSIVCNPSLVNNISNTNSVMVYPNPLIGNEINITSDEEIYHIELKDLQGKLLFASAYTKKTLKLPDLKYGMYILNIHTSEGIRIVRLLR